MIKDLILFKVEKKWFLVLSLFVVLVIAGCGETTPGCIELDDGGKILHLIEYDDNDRPKTGTLELDRNNFPAEYLYMENWIPSYEELESIDRSTGRLDKCPKADDISVQSMRLSSLSVNNIDLSTREKIFTRSYNDLTIREEGETIITISEHQTEEEAENILKVWRSIFNNVSHYDIHTLPKEYGESAQFSSSKLNEEFIDQGRVHALVFRKNNKFVLIHERLKKDNYEPKNREIGEIMLKRLE